VFPERAEGSACRRDSVRELAIAYLALAQISMIRLLVRRLEHTLSHKA
jgi:hypothetical protein